MLFTVTLTYIEPSEKISAHLETHKQWLVHYIRTGNIIAAGPMEPSVGGIAIVHCASRKELDSMLEADSFYQHRLVEYDVRAFIPLLRADIFPAQWAVDAKQVEVSRAG